MARKRIYESTADKQKAYRQRRKSNAALSPDVLRKVASSQVILSLFPGADLWGRAFEELGFCVVRGPDVLWGGDIRDFHPPRGKFDGIIGGPPCQFASKAAIAGSRGDNLIPEYLRIVRAAEPRWAVMENVREAAPFAPSWPHTFLRDWDCGGLTHRARGFWFYGLRAAPKPTKREGQAEYSVLASNWNRRESGDKLKGHLYLSPDEAARLQGYPGLDDKIIQAQPGWLGDDQRWTGVSKASREILATHMLGNGVPHAMALYIAKHVLQSLALEAL
jgi:site-specific DNA-cytosine methylase